MLLNSDQVAEKLGVTRTTVSQWRKQGRFTGIKYGNGVKKEAFKYDSKVINDYIKNNPIKSKKKSKKESKKESNHNPVTGINTRLENIEAMLKKLLAYWE